MLLMKGEGEEDKKKQTWFDEKVAIGGSIFIFIVSVYLFLNDDDFADIQDIKTRSGDRDYLSGANGRREMK